MGKNFEFFHRKPAALTLVLRQYADFPTSKTYVVKSDFGNGRVSVSALCDAPLSQVGIRAVQGGGFVIVFEQAVCTQMQMWLGGGFQVEAVALRIEVGVVV